MSLTEYHPIYVRLEEQDDVVIATFTVEHLSDEENVEQLGHELFTLVDQFGYQRLVLDLGNVTYVTSSVVGKIITLHRKLHRNEGILAVCNLGDTVARVMRTSKLLEYFNVADDVDKAIEIVSS